LIVSCRNNPNLFTDIQQITKVQLTSHRITLSYFTAYYITRTAKMILDVFYNETYWKTEEPSCDPRLPECIQSRHPCIPYCKHRSSSLLCFDSRRVCRKSSNFYHGIRLYL